MTGGTGAFRDRRPRRRSPASEGGWDREPVYAAIAGSLTAWMGLMAWHVRIDGLEHIPTRGPAVLATNHIGYLDWLFIGLAGRRRGRNVRFVAKRELWDRGFTRAVMRGARHIPVDRYGSPGTGVEAAVAALRRGEIVGMFPESTISRSFLPTRGKTGSARMAMKVGAPLIPGAVWGSQRIMTKGRPRNLRRGIAITVTFGDPIEYEPTEDPAAVTERLMRGIGGLVREAIADYPQSPSGPDDRWWLPATHGGTAPDEAEALRLMDLDAAAKRERRTTER